MIRRHGPGASDPPEPATPAPAPGAPTAAALDTLDVQVGDEQDAVELDADRYAALARAVLAAEGVGGPAELTLTFVDEAAMGELNAEHMGEDGSTDVLAFPLDDPDDPRPAGMAALLGDIVVCPAVAQRYAQTHQRSTADELALLVVHGVLHVLGHDHADPAEAALMREHEQRHLRTLVDPAFTL